MFANGYQVCYNYSMSTKKITAVFIAVIVLALALGLYFLLLTSTWPKAVNRAGKTVEPKPAAAAPQITEAAAGQLPQGLPPTLPLYGQGKIIKSYDASYADSAKQAAVVFQSDKSMKASYDYYVKWAKDNGWQIINQADGETLKFVYLRKNGQDINLTITKGPDQAKVKISVSYTKF